MITTPADLFSILIAMACALPCFLCGVFLATGLNRIRRLLLSSACLVIAGILAVQIWMTPAPYVAVLAMVFMTANTLLGAKCCSSILRNRGHIFGSLSVAYLLGLLLGPLGVVILCVPTVLIANRSVRPEFG